MSILKALPMALTAALIATATSAFAAGNLTPGTTITPTDVGGLPFPLTFQYIPFTSPLGATEPYSGQLYSAVVNEGAANPLGGLTFEYGVINDPTSTATLGQLATNGFAAFDTSAYFDSVDGGTIAASSAHRTLGGDTIKFSFLDAGGNEEITPGNFTYLSVVRTNAHNFTQVLDGITDGVESNALAYAPAAVPEASTTASFGLLMLLGLGGVVVASRKKKSSASL